MTEIKTSTGFEISVDESSVNDMELLDLVCRINEGETFCYSKMADKLLGIEGRKKLYDHLRNADGRVPINEFDRELTEIMTNLKDKKK